VLQGLMLRRTSKTKFLGKRIVEEKKVAKFTLKATLPTETKEIKMLREQAEWIFMEEHRKRVDNWTKSGSREDWPIHESLDLWFQLARIFRMTATIPALARLAVDEERILSTRELERNNWLDETQVSPYKTNLKELGDSSDKFKKVLEILERVKAEKKGGKVIIVSEFPVVAFIMHLVSNSRPYTTEMMLSIKNIVAQIERPQIRAHAQ
jgi:hypothetical protein